MEEQSAHGVYSNWISTWRKWKYAWCECPDIVVDFYVQIIGKNQSYSPTNHADLAELISNCLGKDNIEKNLDITVST
ncbi:MAG: hypothetical protein ABJM70_00045 [Ekhidna sp.]